jgi:predicted RNase H-like nuclease (RuvC/YqgF family)
MIKHDKCHEFEAEIERFKALIEELKDEIDKLNKINETLRNQLSEETGIKYE